MIRVARFATADTVTILVGSHAGDQASVEHVVYSERDRCHYFYLCPCEVRTSPDLFRRNPDQPAKKLSRGYRADELAEGAGDTLG